MQFIKDIKENKILLLSLLLHVVIPFFSIGFIHPDEQFYSADFALFKLNLITDYEFTWEHQTQIRPWSLPFLYYLIGMPFKLLGITNPFSLLLIFRLFSSLFGFFSHLFFYNYLEKELNLNNKFKWIFFIAWPIVLMHSRTSSENISASFFLIAIIIGLKFKKQIAPLLSGILIGLTFYIRFQVGIMIPGLLFLFTGLKTKFLFLMGIFFTCVTMIFIDYWGYQKITFSAYNYYYVNLVEDKVSGFGVSPWWDYFYLSIKSLAPFWGLFYILSFLRSPWIFLKNRILIAFFLSVIPFLFIHFLIGHKELRFLYSALPILSVFGILMLEKFPSYINKLLFIVNLISLPILFIPPYKPLLIYQYLFENKDIKKVYYISENDPLIIKAFQRPDLQKVQLTKKTKLKDEFYAIGSNYKDYLSINEKYNCNILKLTYPQFILKFNFFNWVERSNIWFIGKCHKIKLK